MDIGKRLKESRIKSDLSQEEVAEKLNITRQTLSNWENNKCYPDILNVIGLSELYNITLDELIKDDKNMIDHLEESTNIVKSNNRLTQIIHIGIYLLIWAFAILMFWMFTSEDDAFGYSLMVFYVILPITTFIISVNIGKDKIFKKTKNYIPIFLGIMYMLAEYTTFSLANMISFNKINIPDFSMIIIGSIVSYIGLFIGRIHKNNK